MINFRRVSMRLLLNKFSFAMGKESKLPFGTCSFYIKKLFLCGIKMHTIFIRYA